MANTAQLLNQLIQDKKDLVTNLTTKGVECTNEETFTQLVPKVLEITSGGLDTSDATATSQDILLDKTAYVKGEKVTGTIESIEATEYTPTIEDQIINKGKYLSGDQIIKGDLNLIPSNIRKGVSIFNIEGVYEGSSSSSTVVFNCSTFTSVDEVYNAYKDITKVSNDGELATFEDLSSTYNYQIVSPIYSNNLAGINLNTSTVNAAFYLTSPITITSSHTLFKFIYFVSVWINPTIQIALIQADSIDEISTKISAGEFAWTKNIILSNTNNKSSAFYEFDDIPLGEYYIMINAASKFSANEGIINYIAYLGL